MSPIGSAVASGGFARALLERLASRRGSFARYRVRGEVARGGTAIVLTVRDEDLNRDLAMKVLASDGQPARVGSGSSVAPLRLARFLEEAQVTGQLDHPGIVPVHELGVDPDDRVYFTMKLVRGRTLHDVLGIVRRGEQEDGWSQTRVVSAILRVCEAMAYAHDRRVVHRDLKPANVMVGRFGEVYVMDWGLARLLDREDPKDIRIRDPGPQSSARIEVGQRSDPGTPDSPLLTMDGDVVGTPAYMSPEQALGQVGDIGPQTDVYAVGAILYHLLAGHAPYIPTGLRVGNYAIWRLVREGPPAPVHKIDPAAQPELVAICEKAMERDLARRYGSIQELAEDLRAYLEGRVVRAHRTGPAAELSKWVARNRIAAAALGGLVLVIALAGFGLAWKERQRATVEQQRAAAESRRAAAESQRAAEAARHLDEHLAPALVARADELWPIHPSRVTDMEAWLAEARPLIASRPGYAETLATLVARAEETGRAKREPLPVDPALEYQRNDARKHAANIATEMENVLGNARAILGGEKKNSTPEEVRDAWQTEEILPREIEYWRSRLAILERDVPPSEVLRFEDLGESRSYARLAGLVGDLEALERRRIPEIEGRLERSRALRDRTIEEPRSAWSEASASISDAARCPRYGGLQVAPQLGLVPLGQDAQSGLWEFWHVLSGERPRRADDGRWKIGPDTGIVLVLVPGGHTTIGAQKAESAGENFDQRAWDTEGPVRSFDLTAFFLSKYEMTQGQWARATGELPSERFPGIDIPSCPPISRANPVESVSWNECQTVLARWSLVLPTEVQWEHAARGDTRTPYWTGAAFETLERSVNFHDLALAANNVRLIEPTEIDDGFALHAAVGSFPANPFGLHEILGNVAEWCRDWNHDSESKLEIHPGDCEQVPDFANTKVLRGGSFKHPPSYLRVSARLSLPPTSRDEYVGVRPARPLER